MADYIDLIGAFMRENAVIAYGVIFAAATFEAVLFIGLFVPSTAILVTAGALCGTGDLPLIPVLAVTAGGAVLGDAISYWVGRRYGRKVAGMWPFTRYPGLLVHAEVFFARWGASSVFLGRFVPAVKSVVPGVAGMAGMPLATFTVVNVVSAVVWAAAHILPGAGIGLGLSNLPRHALGPAAAVGVVLLVVYFVLRRWIRQRTEEKGEHERVE